MSEPKTFVVSDESVNSYGFRVLTAGIKTDNFKRNPIMLFNHDSMSWGADVYNGPIGRWENLNVSGDQLLADAIFDTADPKGLIISNKVQNNFLRATSIGFKILKTSEAPEDMVPGQTRPTVTECELVEISVVDMPANSNALALYDADNKKIDLKDESDFQRINLGGLSKPQPKTNNSLNMKLKLTSLLIGLSAIAESLGFKDKKEGDEVEFTPETLSEKLQGFNAQIEALTAEKTNLSQEVQTLKDAKAALEGQVSTLTTEKTDAEAKVTSLTAEKKVVEDEKAAIELGLKAININFELKQENGSPVFNKLNATTGNEEYTVEIARANREAVLRKIEENRKAKAGQK